MVILPKFKKNTLSEHIRKIAVVIAKDAKFRLKEIKIFFSAPNPKEAGPETLTIEKEKATEANFQWVSFQVLFSTEKAKYYIYSLDLETNGRGKLPDKVFESDDDWSGENKNNPTRDIDPGDIKRAYPKIFKSNIVEGGPNLFPAKALPFGVPTNYINTHGSDKSHVYSSEEFKKNFDNDFYIVMDPKSKQLKNPFGDLLGGETPEKKEEK